MKMWCFAGAALFTLVSLGILGCDSGSSENGDSARHMAGLSQCSVSRDGYYYIGELQPFSGSISSYGVSADESIALAIEEINAAGGVKGKPIGIVRGDSKTDPDTAVALMKELVGASPLGAIIGDVASANTIPAGAVAASGKKVLMSHASTSPAVTDIADDGYVFRSVPSGASQAKIAAVIAAREGYKKVFVAYRDDPFGNGFKDVFLEAYVKGDAAAQAFPYKEEDASYASAVVEAGMAYGPDAVYLISFVDDGVSILKSAAAAGWSQPKWLFGDGIVDKEFTAKLGNNAFVEGAIGTGPGLSSAENYEIFHTAYKKAYAKEPEQFAPTAYDAAYLIALAMELSADPDDGTQIRDALAKTKSGEIVKPGEWGKALSLIAAGAASLNYDGASGPVDFDGKGDVVGNVEEWTVKAGVITTVGCFTPEGTACP